MWRRLRALIIKELFAVLRDPRSRIILIGPPLMQMLIFSYAATLDVTNVDIGILNRDSGRWSGELVQRLDGAPTFRSIAPMSNLEETREAIDNRQVIAVLNIGEDFSRNIATGKLTEVQVILDGRRSNASQIVLGYLNAITGDLSRLIQVKDETRLRQARSAIAVRHWFNSNLIYMWFTVPGLMGTLGLLIALVVTGQSVARERELGTFDQLMVSPLRVHEILIGKMLPPLIIGFVQLTALILVATLFFEVPLRGGLALLYIGVVFFLAAVIGIGLFISSLSQTQQQAFLGSFLFAAPAILLSGFATPIENMPEWLQLITEANPLRHFLVIARGVFLKDMPPADIAANIVPLIVIAAFTLSSAAWLFRQRME